MDKGFSRASTFSEAFATFGNVCWYKWTTFLNPGGDLVKWIQYEPTPLICAAIVRREDGLIFLNTLSCRACTNNEYTTILTGAQQVGYYLRGTDITDSTYYGMFGRHLIPRGK